eukprot:scaffold133076_cov60-Phaeocystis_antarctica.AAC.2
MEMSLGAGPGSSAGPGSRRGWRGVGSAMQGRAGTPDFLSTGAGAGAGAGARRTDDEEDDADEHALALALATIPTPTLTLTLTPNPTLTEGEAARAWSCTCARLWCTARYAVRTAYVQCVGPSDKLPCASGTCGTEAPGRTCQLRRPPKDWCETLASPAMDGPAPMV